MLTFFAGLVLGIIAATGYYFLSRAINAFLNLWVKELDNKGDVFKIQKMQHYKLDKIIPALFIVVIFCFGWLFGVIL